MEAGKKAPENSQDERIGGALESLPGMDPLMTVAEGVFDLVGSTVLDIGEILSPEEARRRRELSEVMKRRDIGRER